MEGKNNIPLQLLLEGREQHIEVDKKTLLNKIMAAVGYRSPPVFTEVDCGDQGVKVSIALDLSIGDQIKMAVVEGKPFITRNAAESSAVIMTLRHLEDNYMVKVLDFSSRISMSFSAYGTYGYVKDAMDSLKEVIAKFEKTLSRCNELKTQLEGGGVHREINANIYDGIREFVRVDVKSFTDQTLAIRSKMECIEFDRMKHRKKITEKRKAVENKGNMRKVLLTSMVLLDYVLTYFGFEKAKYSNGPDDDGTVDVVVKFRFPYIRQLKYGGKLKKRGKGNTSANAEENAAFEALLFIEENFNVPVVDLNFPERLDAQNEEKMLMRMLGEILCVGESVKDMIDNFVNTLAGKSDNFRYGNSSLLQAQLGENQIEAYKLCLDGLTRMEKDSANCIGAYWTMFDRMQNIRSKVNGVKIK